MVGPHPALAPDGKQWAITAVEQQARCGLGYFGQYVLGVSDETDAATIISIEPAERGVLVHAVFERLAGEWLRLDKHQRPPWLQGDHLSAMHQRAVEILDELATDIGIQHRLGHASAWGAERAHILRSIAATIDAEAAEGSQPVPCEHFFSECWSPELCSGGKIDRIDLMPDGGLRVTDFKTGAPSSLNDRLGRRSPVAAAAVRPRCRSGSPRSWSTRNPAMRHPPRLVIWSCVRPRPTLASRAARRGVDRRVRGLRCPLVGRDRCRTLRPTAPSFTDHCLMCCVDSLGVEELAERARLFEVAASRSEPPPWVEAEPAASMAVSAGAGSGKTTSLVGRVAALLRRPGVQLGQLVVITFTEKAAREVSHRLRQALGHTVPLDEAFIGTIHGFCQSLLRRYPIEAGLPPKFTTADELTSGAMADERAEQAVQTLYNLALKKPAIEEALMVIASFGAMQSLPELVKAIDNDWLLFGDLQPVAPMSIAVAQATVMRMLDQVSHDQRYVSASATMRTKLDDAVAEARATLEYVESVPALAVAAQALSERRTGSSARGLPFKAGNALRQLRAGAQSVDVGADPDRHRVGAQPHQPRRVVVR